MGLSDYPSNSQKRLEGVAVGLFVRYPLIYPTSLREGPLVTSIYEPPELTNRSFNLLSTVKTGQPDSTESSTNISSVCFIPSISDILSDFCSSKSSSRPPRVCYNFCNSASTESRTNNLGEPATEAIATSRFNLASTNATQPQASMRTLDITSPRYGSITD